MKKIYFLSTFLFAASFAFSQTLFTYGGTPVGKEEFLRAYNKNKVPITNKEKALREYLDLYIRFKLKVKAAKDLQIDTLAQLRYDLENFRTQIEESYLNNETVLNNLTEEAFARTQKDLRIVHFYIPLSPSLKPEDTVRAYNAMNEIREQLKNKTQDYEKIVGSISEKNLSIKGGDAGFITAFTLPYEYENLVYSLRIGEVSKAHRSKNGLHIFKVTEERKNPGKWKIAQILLVLPPENQEQHVQSLQLKADSLYNKLQDGADFAALASQYSDDKFTYMNGGEMPEFGTGKFDPVFEKEVFKLQRNGEISKPFLTLHGIHIVKKITQTPAPSDKNDITALSELRQKVLQDARINNAKRQLAQQIASQTGFKQSSDLKTHDLFRYSDSIIASAKDIASYPISNTVVFYFSKGKVTGKDWLNFVKEYKYTALYKGERNEDLWDKFFVFSVLQYYKQHLEEYNKDFHYQMEEFREGNILFEMMERNVWNAAIKDSNGLVKYYNENKDRYKWAASADVLLFHCNGKTAAAETVAALREGKNWRTLAEETAGAVQPDSGRYELTQLPLLPDVEPSPGFISDPVTNNFDSSLTFVKVIQLYAAGVQRSFDEAKGLVVNDYQNVLENKWIKELKRKYPVKINDAVFKSLIK